MSGGSAGLVVRRAVANLDPGAFALVMATGIISVGTGVQGLPVLSRITLVATALAWGVLVVGYGWRAVRYRSRVAASLRDPLTAMGYFTVVAGTNVLAVRLLMAGVVSVAIGLGVVAALLWLVGCYGLPWLVVAGSRRPVLGDVNGTWLIWVVATQSVAVLAAALTPEMSVRSLRSALPMVALCLWSVGVVLCLILLVVIFLRLFLVRITATEMGPAYWIVMGATAISARAAAGILDLHGTDVDLLDRVRPFVTGLSVLLWAFGTWCIPLLVLFGVWRYLVCGYSKAYESRLWSVVFPLGMYTVASGALGKATGVWFLTAIAGVWVWVGLAAWGCVAALMAVAVGRAWHGRGGRMAAGGRDTP